MTSLFTSLSIRHRMTLSKKVVVDFWDFCSTLLHVLKVHRQAHVRSCGEADFAHNFLMHNFHSKTDCSVTCK